MKAMAKRKQMTEVKKSEPVRKVSEPVARSVPSALDNIYATPEGRLMEQPDLVPTTWPVPARSSSVDPAITVEYFETPDDPTSPHYSSTIQSARYELENRRLVIVFKDRAKVDGRSYEYLGVSKEVWWEFRDCQSYGSYFHTHIKNLYMTNRL